MADNFGSIWSKYHVEVVKDCMKYRNSSKVFDNSTIVRRLSRLPQPEQRTQEWFDMRREMITASSAATLIPKQKKYMKEYLEEYDLMDDFKEHPTKGCNPYSNRDDFFIDKCGFRTFFGNVATFWGQKYEKVAENIYSRHIGEKIIEFGLVPHPSLCYLGASPDGISETGKMLEIKVPWRRTITGIPPIYYWVQVQLQLEVCDLEICDFVECKMSEYNLEEEWLKDRNATQKGLILCIGEEKYEYPPVDMTNAHDLLSWANIYAANTPKGVESVHKIYWRLDKICITRIHRNRKWFKRVQPVFYKGHVELKWHQNDKARTLLKKKEKNEVSKKSLDLRPFMIPSTTTKSMIACGGLTDSESESEIEINCG